MADHLSTVNVSGGKNLPCRVRVLALGGGACSALGRMSAAWQDGPEMVAVNTDAQALASCGVAQTVQIGRNVTQGFGAGGDVSMGRLAAEESSDVLRDLVTGVDLLFLVVTLGGGTGTGAASVVAELARDAGVLTIGFATLPFDFEGDRKKQNAAEALESLRSLTDVVVTMPNQYLLSLLGEQASLVAAFQKSDEMLGTAMHTLWKLLMHVGIINLDFADLKNLVENSGGGCVFAYGEGVGAGRVDAAMDMLARNPGLEDGRFLERAGALLVNITGGSDLTLVEVQKIRNGLAAKSTAHVRVFLGAAIEEVWHDRLAVTLLVAEHWSESLPGSPSSDAEKADETRSGQMKLKNRSGGRVIQPHLPFDPTDKGRFKGVDPTIYEGEDLDIPTFIRRGIKLSFDR